MSTDYIQLLKSLRPASDTLTVRKPPGGRVYVDAGGATYVFKKDTADDYFLVESVLLGSTEVLVGGSNKEFAVRLSPRAGAEYNYAPQHTTVGTVFNARPRQFRLNGREVELGEMSASQTGTLFQLDQNCAIRIPGITNSVGIVRTLHTIGADGVLTVLGSLEIKKPVYSDRGYGGMMPVNLESGLVEVVTDTGERLTNKQDGSSTWFSGNPRSFCATGKAEPGMAVAMTIDFPERSLRGDQCAHLWSRAGNGKVYTWQFGETILAKGSTFFWAARFLAIRVPRIHYLLGGK